MPQQTNQQLAAALDALDNYQLHDALLALVAYQLGKTTLEESATCGKNYDAQCEDLRANACEQFNVTEDLLSLLIQVFSADWKAIVQLMGNAKNRDEILKRFC